MAQHNLEQKRLLLIQEEIDKAYEENPIQLPFKRLVAIIKAREGSPPNITHKEVRDARSQRYGSEESMGNLYVRSDSEVEGAVSAFLENQARSFDNPLRHPASFLFSAIEKDRPDIFQRLLIKANPTWVLSQRRVQRVCDRVLSKGEDLERTSGGDDGGGDDGGEEQV